MISRIFILKSQFWDKYVKKVLKGPSMYLLTEWEGRMGKYLALGPYILTENQIFSHPSQPNSVNKHFIMVI